MDQLNRRIDHIDKQLATILQLLTDDSSETQRESVFSQRHDTASTDKMPRGGQSSSFMDTITEQEEDINSSVEAIHHIVNDVEQWQTSNSAGKNVIMNKNSTKHSAQ